MAKVITDVLLKDGTDETTFVNDVTSNDEVELNDMMTGIANFVVLNVEESYIDTLQSHASVVEAQQEVEADSPVTYPSVPSTYTLSNKSIGGTTYWTNYNGQNMISYQHYLDTDHIPDPTPDRTINGVTGHNVGNHYFATSPQGARDQIRHFGTNPASDGSTYGSDSTFYTTYTGKNVDIVTIEGGDGVTNSGYVNYHSTHPDFQDPDNAGTTRMIPMNWSGLSHVSNNQVSSNNMLNDHAVGTLSAAGGIHSGFAKKSSLRTAYLVGSDGISDCLNAVRTWHNSKSNNSETGLPNPTVLLLEWQHTALGKEKAVRIEQIDSITHPVHGTANRPGSGWGSDFSEFVLRDMIPFQLLDPIDGNWYWVMTFGRQTQATYRTVIEQCWDDGIVVINSGGNNGGVWSTNTHANWSGAYCTLSGTNYEYTMSKNASGEQNDGCQIIRGLTNTTTWYPFKCYGPHGIDKSINIAAGQNSEGNPSLDFYTSRGPGVDVIGRGTITWTAGDLGNPVFTDGYRWGTFGGTSCALPTVGGKAACYIEKHYTINGTYPTPDQVKNSMIAEAKATSMSVATTTWSSVPNASGTAINPIQNRSRADGSGGTPCLKIQAGVTAPNGGWIYGDSAGTPSRQAYWNAQNFNREQTYKKRPTSGVLFPRPRKFDIPPIEEQG